MPTKKVDTPMGKYDMPGVADLKKDEVEDEIVDLIGCKHEDILRASGKTFAVVWILMWVRWTFPRLRIDQILTLEWKYLMPLSLIILVLMTVCVALGFHG